MDAPYAALWCKSNYSFLEGASHPHELVEAAHAGGLRALAVTDRNGVYGVVKAHERAKALGMPLIIGAQVTVGAASTLVLLAQTREGYANLCGLLSAGHLSGPKGHFHLSWAQVAEHAADLVALWRPDATGLDRSAELEVLTQAFSGRLYAVMARHRWIHDVLLEAETLRHARKYGLPPVAATEVLYHTPERQGLQDVVTCIRHGVRLADAGTKIRPNAEHSLKTPQEFRSLYADVPEWVARTVQIAEQCRFTLGEIEYRYPAETVGPGYTTTSWLRKAVDDGARERYGDRVPALVRTQLDKELNLIEHLRYSGYFLTMWEIVGYCKLQGILCQGRGSAANSAVCYCLGITAIDPVKMELLFERFLSLERAEPPDIDLDIEHHRREEVIQHMYQKYGRERAAMVANVVSYRGRSALREVGKVLGISEVDLDRCSKMLAHHEEGLPGALRDSGLDPELPVHRKLLRLADQMRGFPRHLSIHPGGFLLGSEAVSRLVPQENATMPGRTVIQWDKTDIETMNLFKVDLLGLGALTHLDYAFRLLRRHRNLELSMAKLPADDPAVYAMISRADTVGVFQIESRAQMSMLPRLRPRNYYDLVIEVSLVRPGPISGGMVHPYLRRRRGEEEVTYPHSKLEPVLKKTLGIPLFQEQVMKLAVEAANYTPGEADQLRRDMAAWRQSGRIEEHRQPLIQRMMANGIEQEFAERVFSQIRGFGEYGFPESHAASFALIAYATAWMKCHHHDVFACALLNAWPMGFYSPASIIGDAKRHGVPFLPADLQHSDWDCTLEVKPGWTTSLAVRMGLRYISGLAKADADTLVAVRALQKCLTLEDWKTHCRVSADTWEKLAVSGALQSFGVHRRNALWRILDQGEPDPLPFGQTESRDFAATSVAESVEWDYSAMGHSTQAHIVQQFRPQLRQARFPAAVEVAAMEAPKSVQYIGLVVCRQMPQTAKGVLFLTLEDETGSVNVVVWRNTWARYRKVILTSPMLAVEGKIQSEEGVVHVVAARFWSPEGLLEPGQIRDQSHDFH